MGIIEKNIKWFFSVILLLYAGCSPCFNTLQTARMLPPKTVEFTPSVSWFSELDPEFLWYQRCYGGRRQDYPLFGREPIRRMSKNKTGGRLMRPPSGCHCHCHCHCQRQSHSHRQRHGQRQ